MIPYGRHYIDDEDIAAVSEALRGDFLTTGPKIAEFENAFAQAAGAKHAVVCANGTAALHIAAIAHNFGPGDVAIVPTVTFLATANAVRFTGADVVFADVNPDTGLMEVEHLEDAMKRAGTRKIKAVFPVHLTGECVDLTALKKITDKHGMKIVADACHAAGGMLHGKPVGACSVEDMSVFSFHPVKTMTMGEGGAVTTNDAAMADVMRKARGHGAVHGPMAPEMPSYYTMPQIGYNYRATDIQCALGLTQLKKLPLFAARRREMSKIYDKLLAPLAPLVELPQHHNYCDAARHLYAVRIDFKKIGTTRAALMDKLKDRGIGTQVHYFPVHRQPYYTGLYGETHLPGAERYFSRTLSLPFYHGLTDDDLAMVARELGALLS